MAATLAGRVPLVLLPTQVVHVAFAVWLRLLPALVYQEHGEVMDIVPVMGVWVHACIGAWVHVCMGAWVHECSVCMGA